MRFARFAKMITLAAITCMVAAGSPLFATTRIMPLGDSITYGAGDPNLNGYRGPLRGLLAATGYSVDFVGSSSHGNFGDTDHEGHSGWRADQIRDSIYSWLTTNPADLVLLHIGTNDISQGQTADSTAVEIGQILDNIQAWADANGQSITVVLGRIINRGTPSDPKSLETTRLNSLIRDLGERRAARGESILLVDHEPALDYPGDLADEVHPNLSGYSKMAAVWYQTLSTLLGEQCLLDLQLASSSGMNLGTDSLLCTYVLSGSANADGVAWYRNGLPTMRLFLPMEGGLTAARLDISGNGHFVAVNGSPTWAPAGGHDGRGALLLAGNDDLNAGEIFPANSSYTKAAWIYRFGSGTGGGNNIISGNQVTGGHAFWVPDQYANKLSAGHDGTWNSVQDNVPLALNTWYHVAVTYHAPSGEMILYKNGSPVSTATVNVPVTDTTCSIGSFGSANYAFNGYIDEVRVYAHALSPQQIASLYATNGNVIVPAETASGDSWQAQVTPFTTGGMCRPQLTNVLAIASDAALTNLTLGSSSGLNLDADALLCTYSLTGTATCAATAWSVNGQPLMRAYLPMEGGPANANRDFSGNSLILSPHGNPVWSPTAGHDGRGAFEFDGNSGFNAGERFPTHASYTKTAWIYRTGSGTGGGNNIITGDQDPGGHALFAPDWYGNKLSAGHNGVWDSVQDSVPLQLHSWYHVAVSYDAASKTMVLYKDGLPVSSANVAAPAYDATISIGSFGAANGYMFKGTIDDVRIYTWALSAAQIAALYDGETELITAAETASGDSWQARVTPFSATEAGITQSTNPLTILPDTPPVSDLQLSSASGLNFDTENLTCSYVLPDGTETAAVAWCRNDVPFTRLYLPMQGGQLDGLRDYSGNTITIIPSGDPNWLATAGPDGHGAVEFDGDDYLSAGERFPINSSYTKAAWVYRTGSGANGGNNILSGNQSVGGHAFWAPDANGNRLSAGHNGSWNAVQDSVPLPLNTWHHVAVTFNHASGAMILYKNGSPIASATVSVQVTDPTICVGSYGNSYNWKGLMKDVRVYSRALSADQIALLATGPNTLSGAETQPGEQWHCVVTPFTTSQAGRSATSNSLSIHRFLMDMDCDGDVDFSDIAAFLPCRSGSNLPHNGSPTCASADFDHDGDVDQADFGLLQRCLSGSSRTPVPLCYQ